MYLAELTLSVRRLRGVGPSLATLLDRLGVQSCKDLLLLMPRDYEDRTRRVGLREAVDRQIPALTTGQVLAAGYFGNRRAVLKLRFVDHLGQEGSLLCFNRDFLKDKYPVGARFHLYGTVQEQYRELQLAQFEISPSTDRFPDPPGLGTILPIYPSTAGLKQASLRKAVDAALLLLTDLTEEIPGAIREKFGIRGWKEILWDIHKPPSLERAMQARRELAFRELWFLIGNILRERHLRSSVRLESHPLPRTLFSRAVRQLSFSLTAGQTAAINDILGDLESGRCMARLLQGDVGAGKTLVAVLSVVPLLEEGHQVAFLAPTELLAQQHHANIRRLLEPLGVGVGLLTASTDPTDRAAILRDIANGTITLAVGTHSLLSPDIPWKDLSCVIVDEQHRFGVRQRELLIKQGRAKHLLMLSATPIPRSLALSVFGDLDVTVLPGLPPGRQPLSTYLVNLTHVARVWEFLRKRLAEGQQAYVVVPLIEESETRNLTPLLAAFDQVRAAFPDTRVAMIHGRMKDDEKTATMRDFVRGDIAILCATSVIEVGVDVPNATCMVIYHSEVFGLSALHQLRGRVGRGSKPGHCFLVYAEPLTEEAKERLKIVRETTDGFELAERDLALRGPGEFLGVRQSGFVRLRAADWKRDADLLLAIRDELIASFQTDPQGDWVAHLRNGTLFPIEETP